MIYENFKWNDERLHFANKVSIGLWGVDHILQSEANKGTTFITAHIKNKEPNISRTGYILMYTKCSFNVPTFYVPSFARWILGEKKYFETKALNNDKLWFKIPGVKYLNKKKNNKLIYPLSLANILNRINLVGNRKKDAKNSDYFQYVILVRNAPACSPLKRKF